MEDPATGPSRRAMIGVAAVGASLAAAAAAAVAGSARAAAPAQSSAPQGTRPTDPRSKYPRPPFKDQKQQWPGLASKMDPRPDHGETSYVGHGRLTGRRALITGGDSGIGRAAAIAYAREGADVAINYYPSEEPDAREVVDLIRAVGRKAVAIPGDLRDAAFCRRLVADAVKALGGLDTLVNNAARQISTKSILDISDADFDATMKTNIYAPFYIIKAALPHLPPGSVIIGTTSEQAYDPSEDLYDYAQTKAATMNYVKSLAKQLAPRASASAASRRGRSGRRSRSPAALNPRSWSSSAATRRAAARGSRSSSPASSSASPRTTAAIPPATSSGRAAARASRRRPDAARDDGSTGCSAAPLPGRGQAPASLDLFPAGRGREKAKASAVLRRPSSK